MIINHTYKFIFIHVPKTAGTSISNYLSQYTGWNEIELGGTTYGEDIQEIYRKRFLLGKHTRASLIRNKIGQEMWDQYYKFAVVRNPFDRLVSAYHFYLGWDHSTTTGVKKYHGFSEFVFSDYLAEDIKKPSRACGLQSESLEVDGKCAVDFVCKFENIDEDMEIVAERLGLEKPRLQRHNPSKHRDYRKYYTDELIQHVLSIYEADFRMFGYDTKLT